MPRQKWRGISIFVMTNPFEPPKKLALGDADLAEALTAAQGEEGLLGAMELLEQQSELRAADSQAYVLWVREMEKLATPEAKEALSAARLASSGITPQPSVEQTVAPVTEDSWKSLVPDWDDRQHATELAKEKAIADALSMAEQKAQEEIDIAVAAAVAEAEFEAEVKREEAVAKVVAEAEAAAAEKLAEQVRIAEEQAEIAAAAEQERLEAERVEAERVALEQAEAERVEVARVALELAEAERVSLEQAEAERAEELIREELEKAELAAMEALIAAEEEAKAAAEILANEEPLPAVEDVDPQPVRAVDFATGSFDIIDSAEQAASDDFDEDSFEVLLTDGELGFAKEPAGSLKDLPISTIDRRAKPYSQLFVWSSLSAGLLPLVFGYLTLPLQLTFVDKLLSLFAGLSVSALLIAVAAIGGKRSGLPTLYLSRAAFGVRANNVPAAAIILVKLAFGVAFVLAAISLFDKTVVSLPAMTSPAFAVGDVGISWLLALAAIVLAVASLIAFFGGKTLYFAQLAIAAVATIVSIVFMILTAPQIGLDPADLVFSNNWISVVSLAILVAVIFGGFWITSVAEFTRKVSMAQSGKKLAMFIALSVGVIPLLIATFSLLVASSLPQQFVEAAALNPLGALLALVPSWMGTALLISGALSLLIWVTAWLYSTSVSLSAVSIRIKPAFSQPLLVVLTFAIAFTATTFSTATFAELIDAVIAISGVVVFAWAGVFIADVTLRKIAYHEVSLTRDYGFYKAANFVNLGAFVVAVALGLGFVSSTLVGLGWLGYLSDLVSAQAWSDANIGAAIALGFSVLFPILFGRKRIRDQEGEVLAIEARKMDLEHVDLDEN